MNKKRENLFEIIYNNLCMENNWVTKESIYKAADAIIESGLLKDEKVYQYVNGNYCSKCNHFLSFKGYNYCPTCGAKLKE